ncbi:nucleotidyltransferase family protein [Viridibacterium curvum]|uniref:Nucleotidyltransferase family protein n=1 Tax=Viridibacterium curvum TaxID=1101404 RepID=A0ABP9QL15_9RHOO
MRALLLAAGFGTRLRPITDSVPKCLVRIQGKPLLQYWLDALLPAGIERVLVNTHYLPGVVNDFVAASPWRDRISLVHEDILLGTGGTVLRNRDFFGREAFIVAHADNLTRFDVGAFLAAHANRPAGVAITMMSFDTDAPQSCGILELDAEGIVRAFHEKQPNPPGTRANAAVYIFEPEVVDFIASLGKQVVDLSLEVLPHYLGRMHCFHNADYHRDIGNPESLRRAELEY